MELQFSPNAPSARKFQIMLREKGLLGAVPEKPGFIVGQVGGKPVAHTMQQTTVLFDDRGEPIVDAPDIIHALDTKGSGPRLVPEDGTARMGALRLLVLADGALEMGVQIFLSESAPAGEEKTYWVERWTKAIDTGLAAAEQMAPKAEPLTIGGIAMATTLTWFDAQLPEVVWKAKSPALAKLQSTLEKRPSFRDVRVSGT